MRTGRGRTVLVAGTMLFGCVQSVADGPRRIGPWDIAALTATTPAVEVMDHSGPVHSLVYAGEPIENRPTRVFAFFASPNTLDPGATPGPYPGIILLHGGGGMAFSDWVWDWARRGYAALAMDLGGRVPPRPHYDGNGMKIPDFAIHQSERPELEGAGMDDEAEDKFGRFGGSVTDDWPYHAVANVFRAHNVLRQLPRVDPDRIAVTGISWGGYLTCLVASLDDRYVAAVPVYGCGFLAAGESVQRPQIERLGQQADAWTRLYDPSSYLERCTVPTFWVNGTTDPHYPLGSYARSYELVPGPITLRIEPGMKHSHPSGWAPREIARFIDAHTSNGPPLPSLTEPRKLSGGGWEVGFSSPFPPTAAALHFTTDTGLRRDRRWMSVAAAYDEARILVPPLPAGVNTWLVSLTDSTGAMVTTRVQFGLDGHDLP